MNIEQQFNKDMLEIYIRAGREVGYWANYFLRSVRENGGLATARRMLRPTKNESPHKGFQALVDAGRPDISMEALVIQPQYSSLFTDEEIAEASRRLQALPSYAHRRLVSPEALHAETLPSERPYVEGAAKQVTVNAYERDQMAREACIKKHGCRCAVCEMNFEDRYGAIGRGFIHVHHKKPLATIRREYELNPEKDLIPVCPNCHAMLHTSDPPLSVSELKIIIGERIAPSRR